MHRPSFLSPLSWLLASAALRCLFAPEALAGASETLALFDRDARRFDIFHDQTDAVPDESFSLDVVARNLLPLAGDFDGDGETELAVYDPWRRSFRLFADRDDGAPDAEIRVRTFRPWLRPLAGDFDGDGRDELALYDRYARRMSILDAAGSGRFTRVFQLSFRRPDHLRPFAGDFDGDGRDEPGLYDGHAGTVHLLAAGVAGGVSRTLRLAERGHGLRPVAFDGDGDGRDGLGLFDLRTGRMAVIADLADGDTDGSIDLSGAGGVRRLPVAGVFAPPAGEPAPPDVPDTEWCQAAAIVDPLWARYETELLTLLNAQRAAGGSCGSEGFYEPTLPLVAHPALRCAARLHVRDMAARDAVTQFGADGSVPEVRAAAAGYPVLFTGETVAGGLPDPAAVLAGWLADGPVCAMLMEPAFEDAAAGFAEVPGGRRFFWVLDLGIPAP